MSDDLTPPHWNELPENVAPAAVFPPPHCTAWEDCEHDGICHDPKCCAAIGPNHEAFYGRGEGMTAPDRIFLGAENSDGEAEVWFDPDEGGTEYIRRDSAVLAALPEVQALIRQAVEAEREACAQVAHDWQNETGTNIAASARICPQIAAAIRKRGEGMNE